MQKTKAKIVEELSGLLDNYWDNIKSAYEKSGYSLNLSIKVGINAEGQETVITPMLEFYPEPKTKSAKYDVRVNEKQLSIAGM